MGVNTDNFGFSVSISNNIIGVGAPFRDNRIFNSGLIYLYEKDEGGINNWGQVLEINASDAYPDDRFGYDISVYNNSVMVGTLGTNKGYIYEPDKNNKVESNICIKKINC